MRITISGPPGSGKTTVCSLLGERLGYETIISGNIFRELAKERNMSLAEFGALCSADPAVDIELDSKMVEIAKSKNNVILEGRLTAYMLHSNNIPAFKIYLHASKDVRAERVVNREGGSIEQRKSEIEEREGCEVQRYKKHYSIDIEDTSVYDLVIDSSHLSPDEVVEKILSEVQ